jgi:putative oxidoreductase
MSEQPTSILPGSGDGYGSGETGGAQRPARRPLAWNAGTDAGLLLLRFAVGGVFFAHGAQKVFGLWGGPGITEWAASIERLGYTNAATLAWVTGIGELVLGAFVVLGVLVPFAAAGMLAIELNAVLLKAGGGFFIATGGADAVELNVVLGLAAAALVLTGPGRIALDHGPWHRRPAWGVLALILGVAVGVLVYVLLRP